MPVRSHRVAPSRAPVAPVHRGPGASTSHGAEHSAPNAALLIDFDNVTMGIRSDLQTELRNLLSSAIVKGKVAVQRAYADWRRYPQYIVPLSESSIDLIFAPAYGSSKKNATDIRLAVDAIELIFTRPEIGTYILLSGDSDFSSLVLKLKEYGRYVIGVGIRESSSDLLVQNCDEYYSYNALAGLVKSSEDEVVKWDPWELVVESVGRMQRNGDVMRADRLKQVMQDIDPNFDEGNLGMAKFSKFCHEAAQRGLLKVTKLENGQLEVAPGDGAVAPARTAAAAASSRAAPSKAAPSKAAAGEERGEREGRDGRSRRGRRGRGRERVREERVPEAGASVDAAAAVPRPPAPASAPQGGIGVAGTRLTRDEAFENLRRAVAELANGDAPAPADAVRQRVYSLLGRDSESLSEKNFSRILRDAHDGNVVDIRRRGDSFEVSPAASAPPVTEQLATAEAGHAAARAAAAEPAVKQRSITGRRPSRGKQAAPPPDLLSVGVVESDRPAAAAAKAPAEKKPARKRAPRKKAAKRT